MTKSHKYHKSIRLALGAFAICKTKNILNEAEMIILPEMRDINNAKQQ
jgi:hypothetical protein